jgi:hypothetical protein
MVAFSFMVAFSHELQPPNATVLRGPVQPSTQFGWQLLHTTPSLNLLVGQEVTQ